jgi:Leucine-rich repeat (LRR) protein
MKDIIPFPNNLECFILEKTNIKDFFEKLPTSIVNIYCATCKIEYLPDLSHLVNLEFLDVHDNYLETIQFPFPKNIKTLDFSYTMIKNIC